MGRPQGSVEPRLAEAEVRLEEPEQVVRGRAQRPRPRPGQGGHVPARGRLEREAVAGRQPFPGRRGQLDPRVGHPQGIEHAAGHERLVVGAGPRGQGMAQQPRPEVRVLDRLADRPQQVVGRQEGHQVGLGVVGVRVPEVRGIEVVGQARQPRAVGGEMERRDLDAVAAGQVGVGAEQLLHRRVEPDLAALDHVGQHDGREHLGDGADLEDGVRVGHARVASGEPAVPHHPPAAPVHQADDDADGPLLGLDEPRQDLPDLLVGGKGSLLAGTGAWGQQDGDDDAEHAMHGPPCSPGPSPAAFEFDELSRRGRCSAIRCRAAAVHFGDPKRRPASSMRHRVDEDVDAQRVAVGCERLEEARVVGPRAPRRPGCRCCGSSRP